MKRQDVHPESYQLEKFKVHLKKCREASGTLRTGSNRFMLHGNTQK